MANRLTDEDKLRINEVYYLTHNYAETARQTGFSAASVRKYVIPDFIPKQKKEVKKFDEKIPDEIDLTPFIKSENWGEFCELSEEERKEIENLWEDLVV